MRDIQPELQQLRKAAEPAGIGRRRLLRAGLAAAPVVLAVSGRSAMAAACPAIMTPATAASLDPDHDGNCIDSSHHPLTRQALGLSPGYWKPNPNGQTFQPPHPWPIAPFAHIEATDGTPYTWNPGRYTDYKKIASDAAGYATGTQYRAIFTQSLETRSFSRILLDDNGSVHWHLCAAYLNAAAMAGTYAMTVGEVLLLGNKGQLVPLGTVLTDGQIKAFLTQTWT